MNWRRKIAALASAVLIAAAIMVAGPERASAQGSQATFPPGDPGKARDSFDLLAEATLVAFPRSPGESGADSVLPPVDATTAVDDDYGRAVVDVAVKRIMSGAPKACQAERGLDETTVRARVRAMFIAIGQARLRELAIVRTSPEFVAAFEAKAGKDAIADLQQALTDTKLTELLQPWRHASLISTIVLHPTSTYGTTLDGIEILSRSGVSKRWAPSAALVEQLKAAASSIPRLQRYVALATELEDVEFELLKEPKAAALVAVREQRGHIPDMVLWFSRLCIVQTQRASSDQFKRLVQDRLLQPTSSTAAVDDAYGRMVIAALADDAMRAAAPACRTEHGLNAEKARAAMRTLFLHVGTVLGSEMKTLHGSDAFKGYSGWLSETAKTWATAEVTEALADPAGTKLMQPIIHDHLVREITRKLRAHVAGNQTEPGRPGLEIFARMDSPDHPASRLAQSRAAVARQELETHGKASGNPGMPKIVEFLAALHQFESTWRMKLDTSEVPIEQLLLRSLDERFPELRRQAAALCLTGPSHLPVYEPVSREIASSKLMPLERKLADEGRRDDAKAIRRSVMAMIEQLPSDTDPEEALKFATLFDLTADEMADPNKADDVRDQARFFKAMLERFGSRVQGISIIKLKMLGRLSDSYHRGPERYGEIEPLLLAELGQLAQGPPFTAAELQIAPGVTSPAEAVSRLLFSPGGIRWLEQPLVQHGNILGLTRLYEAINEVASKRFPATDGSADHIREWLVGAHLHHGRKADAHAILQQRLQPVVPERETRTDFEKGQEQVQRRHNRNYEKEGEFHLLSAMLNADLGRPDEAIAALRKSWATFSSRRGDPDKLEAHWADVESQPLAVALAGRLKAAGREREALALLSVTLDRIRPKGGQYSYGEQHQVHSVTAILGQLAESNLRAGKLTEAWQQAVRALNVISVAYSGSLGLWSARAPVDPRATDTILSVAAPAIQSAAGPLSAQHQNLVFMALQRPGNDTTGEAISRMGERFFEGQPNVQEAVRKLQALEDDFNKACSDSLEELLKRLTPRFHLVTSPSLRGCWAERILGHLEKIQPLLKQIVAEHPKYFIARKGYQPATLDDTAAQLRPGEAMIVWRSVADATIVQLVSRDKRVVRSVPVGAKALQEKIARLRKPLQSWDGTVRSTTAGSDKSFDLALAHELYTLLFGPVAGELANIRHVILVPSGALTGLPFNVLLTDRPQPAAGNEFAAFRRAPWLIRRHAITVLPAAGALKPLRQQARASRAPKPFVGFGNPDFTSRKSMAVAAVSSTSTYFRGGLANLDALASLAPLPESEKELAAMATTLRASSSDVVVGTAASEGAVKGMSADGRLAQYRVLAFATHGLVSGEVAGLTEPAVVLSLPQAATEEDDGLLKASEVASLKLDADWVILSACNTAAGDSADAEALSGLARSFFLAGTRALLVSHWPVDSDAAVKLTTSAVAAAAADPALGRAEALRRAMLAMIDKGPAADAHPAVWAPFVLVGEGGGATK